MNIKNIINLVYIMILPISFIWGLNTLFLLDIEYSFQTWVAMFNFILFFEIFSKHD